MANNKGMDLKSINQIFKQACAHAIMPTRDMSVEGIRQTLTGTWLSDGYRLELEAELKKRESPLWVILNGKED